MNATTYTKQNPLTTLGCWLAKHTQHVVLTLSSIVMAWEVTGLFFTEAYAPPFGTISIGLGIAMLVMPIARIWGFYRLNETVREVRPGFFWPVFAANIGIVIIASTYYFGQSGTFWKITDPNGQILQEASYDPWKFGYNATDPVEYSGPFQWDKTMVDTLEINGQECEILWRAVLKCPKNYDNAKSLRERQFNYANIEAGVAPYLPRVFEEAERNQANCMTGNWIPVKSTFDPKTIRSDIPWTDASFTCSYRFKPII